MVKYSIPKSLNFPSEYFELFFFVVVLSVFSLECFYALLTLWSICTLWTNCSFYHLIFNNFTMNRLLACRCHWTSYVSNHLMDYAFVCMITYFQYTPRYMHNRLSNKSEVHGFWFTILKHHLSDANVEDVELNTHQQCSRITRPKKDQFFLRIKI